MSTLKRKAGDVVNGNEQKKPRANGNIASFFGAPKPAAPAAGAGGKAAAAVPEAPAPKFNKQKWVDGLTEEQKELLQLEIDTLHESWLAHLKDDITTKEFLELKRFLNQETKRGQKWFPPAEDIYSWSRHSPFSTVKVVIVGQDPYHNHNQAHGMAFSVRPPTPAPPSLKNIYKALKNDYPMFVEPLNRGGLLTPWADRGVVMLNTCLTVRAHDPSSHSNKGWERFTQKVIDLIAKRRTRGVVFMAWGTPAGKRVQGIDKNRHLVLSSVHPSPFSAMKGFFECGHFRKANDWLVTRYGPEGEIDWALRNDNTTMSKKKVAEPEEVPESEPVPAPEAEKADKEKPEVVADAKKKAAEKPEFDELDDEDDEEALQAVLEAEEEAKSSQK